YDHPCSATVQTANPQPYAGHGWKTLNTIAADGDSLIADVRDAALCCNTIDSSSQGRDRAKDD
ncbi:hypothetical protein A2U01_0112759, partial [Trifolium medium]|nr:hypothetical protein [Trifolium medium]